MNLRRSIGVTPDAGMVGGSTDRSTQRLYNIECRIMPTAGALAVSHYNK